MRMILDAGNLSAIDYMKAHLARTEFAEKVRRRSTATSSC